MPRNAKLQYLFVCDAVATSPDLKPTFYGLFSVIRSPKFPFIHPAMVVAWGIRIWKPCELSLQLLSPNGDVLQGFDPVRIETDKECIVGGQHSLTQIKFPEAGEYKFRLVVDDKTLGDMPVVLMAGKIGSSDESNG